MFELDVSGGRDIHNHDQNVTEDDIVICEFEITFVEKGKFLLVHESDALMFWGGSYIYLFILLSSSKRSSIFLVLESTSYSGSVPSSKNILIAFCIFHLALVRN